MKTVIGFAGGLGKVFAKTTGVMSVDQRIIVNGHIAPDLLRDFALQPGGFDDDTVEDIWQHLDECQGCIADYEALRDGGKPGIGVVLVSAGVPVGEVDTRGHPVELAGQLEHLLDGAKLRQLPGNFGADPYPVVLLP